jgi:hypothetical protein
MNLRRLNPDVAGESVSSVMTDSAAENDQRAPARFIALTGTARSSSELAGVEEGARVFRRNARRRNNAAAVPQTLQLS